MLAGWRCSGGRAEGAEVAVSCAVTFVGSRVAVEFGEGEGARCIIASPYLLRRREGEDVRRMEQWAAARHFMQAHRMLGAGDDGQVPGVRCLVSLESTMTY